MRPATLRLWAISTAALLVLPSFSAAQDYKIAFVSARKGESGIYVMNGDGSGMKRLTDDGDGISFLTDGAWSPDGQRLIFYPLRKQDSGLRSKYNIPFHFPLYIIDANGAGQKRLLDVSVVLGEVRWSPDGKRLLFASAYEDPHRNDPGVRRGIQTLSTALYILDMGTAKSKRITIMAETDLMAFPSWSPDGIKVVFSCGRPPHQPREICVVNVDGTHEQQLTTRGESAVMPTWSSDGRQIAFVAARRSPSEQQGGAYVIDANGTNQKRVSRLLISNVSWSPDGKSLLIDSSGGTYIVNIEGNYATKLSLGSGRVLGQVFSPDGRNVIYRCNEEGKDKIYAISVDGTGRRRLIDDAGRILRLQRPGFDDIPEDSLFAVSPLLPH